MTVDCIREWAVPARYLSGALVPFTVTPDQRAGRTPELQGNTRSFRIPRFSRDNTAGCVYSVGGFFLNIHILGETEDTMGG